MKKTLFYVISFLVLVLCLILWFLTTPYKYILQSHTDLTSGKVARAVSTLEIAHKKYPNNSLINFNLAKSYLYLGETEQATNLIKEKNIVKELIKNKNFQDFLIELSEANHKLGNEETAKSFSEAYLNNTDEKEVSKRRIKHLILIGQILDNRSIEIWEKAYNLASHLKSTELKESIRALLLPKYYGQVDELKTKKRFDDALLVLKKADVVGTNAEVSYLKATIYSQSGKSDLAQEYFEEAIEQKPDNDDYKISYANTLKRMALATRDQNKRTEYAEKIKLLLGNGKGDPRKISILKRVINLNTKYKITNANLKITMVGDFQYPSLEFQIKPVSSTPLKKMRVVFLDENKKQLDYYESAVTKDELDKLIEVTSRIPLTTSNFAVAKVFFNDEFVKEYSNK